MFLLFYCLVLHWMSALRCRNIDLYVALWNGQGMARLIWTHPWGTADAFVFLRFFSLDHRDGPTERSTLPRATLLEWLNTSAVLWTSCNCEKAHGAFGYAAYTRSQVGSCMITLCPFSRTADQTTNTEAAAAQNVCSLLVKGCLCPGDSDT